MAEYCPNQEGSNFVMLSARPKSYKSFSEHVLYYTVLKPLMTKGLLISYPVLLMGSLGTIPRAVVRFLAGKRWAVFVVGCHCIVLGREF